MYLLVLHIVHYILLRYSYLYFCLVSNLFLGAPRFYLVMMGIFSMSISKRLEDMESIEVLQNEQLEGAGIVYQEICLLSDDYESDLDIITDFFGDDWRIKGRDKTSSRYFFIDGEEKEIEPDIVLKKNIKNTHKY